MATRTVPVRRKQGGIIQAGLIALAVLASAIIIAAGYRRPSAPPESAAPRAAEFETVDILVPVEPVAAGTRVRDIRFKTVPFPRHQMPPGAITDIASFSDAAAIAPLPAGLPLFSANFSAKARINNPVLERIPPGMRAMTIRVDATTAVEGWAGSGSVVDVLLIEKNRTSVIAEKVTVLSAERSVSPVEGQTAPNVPSTVTLLVSQEQCLSINTAIPLGKIAFALRSTRDETGWAETSFSAERLKAAAPSDRPQSISGYIAIKDGTAKAGTETAYALNNGKWVRTEIVPEGFLAGRNNEEN